MSRIACLAATGNAHQEDTVDHPQDPLDPERPPSAVPGDPHLQPLASILFGTAGDSLLKAYPPLPMDDASGLMHRIAHDQQLTPVERADSMLGLVSMPGTVLFNADDTKAWQVLLGGVARPILPPPHHPHAEQDGQAEPGEPLD
jgi:hypothetical protein